MTTLQEAISAARAGDSERAQLLAADVIQRDPDDAQAWYLLSQLVESDARRAAYLRKTLALDPGHARARVELDELSPDLFDTQPIVVGTMVGAAVAEESVPPVEWVAEEPVEVVEAVAPAVEPVAPAAEPVAAPVWEEPPAPEAPVEVVYAATAESTVTVETPPAPAAPVDITPVATPLAPAPVAPPTSAQPARRPKRGNQGLALLFGVLVFLTLIVLAFLIYLLFFA